MKNETALALMKNLRYSYKIYYYGSGVAQRSAFIVISIVERNSSSIAVVLSCPFGDFSLEDFHYVKSFNKDSEGISKAVTMYYDIQEEINNKFKNHIDNRDKYLGLKSVKNKSKFDIISFMNLLKSSLSFLSFFISSYLEFAAL